MIVKVTQSHIDRGCRGDGQACPVALAITEATGCTCIVEPQYITLNPYSVDFVVVRTPLVVTKFIAAYDVSVEVEPFEFELDVEGVGMSDVLTPDRIAEIEMRGTLQRLLIPYEKGEFLKEVRLLVDEFSAERLADWYVELNARRWPDKCPVEVYEPEPEWAIMELLRLIEEKVEARYLTLRWRAVGHGNQRAVQTAQALLASPSAPPDNIRKDWKGPR